MISDLAAFKDFIRKATGIHLEGAGEEKLAVALLERIKITKCENDSGYLRQIVADKKELRELINLLTINETYFYREPQQLHLLAETIVPRLLELAQNQRPINILSAGCSSGEEIYSLAILLREKYGGAFSRFCLLQGVDIDSNVLVKARDGRYGDFSFRGAPDWLRKRYFVEDGHFWQLVSAIRQAVTFQEMNLQNITGAAHLPLFDIVLFRNVSIYFALPERKQILQNLFHLMKKDAFLISGITETIGNDLGIFRMVEENGLYYFVKGQPPLSGAAHLSGGYFRKSVNSKPPKIAPVKQAVLKSYHPRPAAASLPFHDLPFAGERVTRQTADVEELSLMVRQERYDEALPLLNYYLSENSNDYRLILLQSYALLNRKQFVQAADSARQALKLKPWNIDALLLLGLTARLNQKPEESIAWFKQAVYACPTCWPAHYYLADSYNQIGETGLASRSYRTAHQLLLRTGADTGVQVVSIDLLESEVQKICKQHLATMEKGGSEEAEVRSQG